MRKAAKFLIFIAIMLSGIVAAAEEATISIRLEVFDYGAIIMPSEVKLQLLSGNECVAQEAVAIDGTSETVCVDFSVPDYKKGKTYYLVATEGVTALKYTGARFQVGTKVPLNTADAMEFSVEAVPLYKPKTGERAENISLRVHMKNKVAFPTSARFFLCDSNGKLLSAKTAKLDAGASVCEIEFPTKPYYTGEQFYLVSASGVVDTTYYDTTYKKFAPIKIGTYAALGENGEKIIGNSFDVGITADTESAKSEYAGWVERYVNSAGIDSKTDYFIWVSKKDFKVNVLSRNNGEWDYLTDFDCTIGKPSTPTIEGVFEYFQYQEKWTYPNYYVAPIMRFAPKGYALHSTLVKYDGTPYDARLGEKLSHGCVRMAPKDIKWLSDNIPLHTRVLVTE